MPPGGTGEPGAVDAAEDVSQRLPPAPRSLRSNFSWTVAGNVTYAATQWGVLTLVAKLTSPEELGKYALSLAICTPVFYLAMLQLRGIQATDAKNEYSFGEYLGLRTVATLLVLAIFVPIVLLVPYFDSFRAVILLVAIVKTVDSFSDILYGLFQKHEQMDLIAKAQIVNGTTSLALFAAGMFITGKMTVGIAGSLVGSVGMLAFYSVRARQMFGQTVTTTGSAVDGAGGAAPAASGAAGSNTWLRRQLGVLTPDLTLSRMRSLLLLALPMGFVMLLSTLNTSVPRYAIENWMSKADLGVFAALAYLLVAGSTVVSAMGQAAAPRLSKSFAEGRTKEYSGLLVRLVAFAACLGIAGALLSLVAGEQILTLLYTAEYGEHAGVLVVMSLTASLSFAAAYMGFGMTAARIFVAQVRVGLVVTGVTVLASVILVPRYGLVGGALALAAAQSANLLIGALVIRSALVRARKMEGT